MNAENSFDDKLGSQFSVTGRMSVGGTVWRSMTPYCGHYVYVYSETDALVSSSHVCR